MRFFRPPHLCARFVGLAIAAGAPLQALAADNLLINGGFEKHAGVGTIPDGWQVIDENARYFGWIAPRVERVIGNILPRSGRHMIGLDTEMMGVDSRGRDHDTPRSAIYQTITVPGRCQGTFSIFYNDIGSTALSHVSAIHLAYSMDHHEIQRVQVPLPRPASEQQPLQRPEELSILPPDTWSRAFYRVSQQMPFSEQALGDWSPAAIRVTLDTDAPQVQLTLWIGIFCRQNSTEIGYWRIDDAAFVLEDAQAATQPAP